MVAIKISYEDLGDLENVFIIIFTMTTLQMDFHRIGTGALLTLQNSELLD